MKFDGMKYVIPPPSGTLERPEMVLAKPAHKGRGLRRPQKIEFKFAVFLK